MVRSQIHWTLTIGLVAVALAAACSGDEPDRPESLAVAAVLTVEDLGDGSWQSTERTSVEFYPTPDLDATPFPVPEALASCDEFFRQGVGSRPPPPPSLSSAHGRSFFERESGNPTFVSATVQVFASKDAAETALQADDDRDVLGIFAESVSDECRSAFAASAAGVDDGSAMLVHREREVDFDIRGVRISQIKMTSSSSAGVETAVSTSASFARGHIIANYSAYETEDGSLDHEDLIRTFIARVTTAQLEDRANAED